MRRSKGHKSWLVLIVAHVLCLTWTAAALADAKSDLTINPKGPCASGGITFAITNNNANKAVHATVSQSTGGSTTTIDISLLPGEQKVLGCSAQTAAGNFQTVWQVQSAQYQ